MWKLKQDRTPSDTERIRSLEERLDETVGRLDAAVAESRRLNRQMDELTRRDPMRPLREAIAKQSDHRAPDEDPYDPDDTVKLPPPRRRPT